MASNFLKDVGKKVAFYAFAVFNMFLYAGLSMRSSAFFKKDTEQDKLQYAIGKRTYFFKSAILIQGQ